MTVACGPAMEDKRLRVLIAENHPDLSEVMERIIDAEPDMRCVGRIASAHEVIATARDSSAEALVLDLTLRDGSGFQLIERLAQELPGLKIVVYSGLAHTEEAARECKKRGAADFVSKGGDFNVLLGALRKTA
jgi:two-component system, NarL family, invasion response regulator UvrY